MMSDKSFHTMVLILLNALGLLATDIYLPSLPAMSTYFSSEDAMVQMTLFSYLITFSLTPLVTGPLTDHWGRKPFLYFGLITSTLATLLTVFSPTIEGVIFLRAVQGIGLGTVTTANRSAMRDLFSGRELARLVSLFTIFIPLMLTLAPLLGGFLQQLFNWQAVFLFLALLLFLSFVLILKFKEPLKEKKSGTLQERFASYLIILKNKGYMLSCLTMMIPSFCIFVTVSLVPFIYQDTLGLSPAEYGLLSPFFGGSIIFSSMINRRLLLFWRVHSLIDLGLLFIFLAGATLAAALYFSSLSTATLTLSLMLFFTCIPFTMSNSISTAFNRLDKNFGTGASMITFLQFSSGAIGALFVSTIEGVDARFLAMCFLLSALLCFLINNRLKVIDRSPL